MNSEERIKDLCVQAIAAEGEDFPLAAEVLHAALIAHVQSLRVMAATAVLNPTTQRSNSPEA